MRVVEALILVLALLYVVASIYYISNDYIRRLGSTTSDNIPNLSNLPRNISGQDLYLVYRVNGYVNMNGSIINVNNTQMSLNARYIEAPILVNATGNQTNVNSTAEEKYYSVTASSDPLIIWALRNLIMLTYNITNGNFSIAQGWKANSPSDIFGNLSLFRKAGSGELRGISNVSIRYTEYIFNSDKDTVIVWIDGDRGIPLLCRINTSWANLEIRLSYAS